MYYDSKMIDGKMHIQTQPKGEWILATGKVAEIANAMAELDDDERREVMVLFCSECGCIQDCHGSCQCWNDE